MNENTMIMVVEDEALLLQAIEKKLTNQGYQVIACKTGEEALNYLSSGEALPNAIWLDYYLTDMNGLKFMTSLKNNSQWADIPVIVVSNSASPDKVNEMLLLGVKEYILKAENRLEDIIETLDKYAGKGGEEQDG